MFQCAALGVRCNRVNVPMARGTSQETEKTGRDTGSSDCRVESEGPGEEAPLESSPTRAGFYSNSAQMLRKHLLDPLILSEHPPWFDARGAAVGFFVALGMPVGSHMLIMGALRVIFRFNFLIAFAFSWIINPFTILPIYYADYRVGSLLMSTG